MKSEKFITTKNYILFLIILTSCKPNYEKYADIKKELISIYIKDQTNRIDANWVLQSKVDEQNLIKVTKIIDSVGWLSKSDVGDTANAALFLVLQHSNKISMEKYYPILKKAVFEKKASKENLALLTDRIEILNGRPQIYGTQGRIINNEFILDSILDFTNVDQRRKEMDMIPLKEYILELKKINKLGK